MAAMEPGVLDVHDPVNAERAGGVDVAGHVIEERQLVLVILVLAHSSRNARGSGLATPASWE